MFRIMRSRIVRSWRNETQATMLARLCQHPSNRSER